MRPSAGSSDRHSPAAGPCAPRSTSRPCACTTPRILRHATASVRARRRARGERRRETRWQGVCQFRRGAERRRLLTLAVDAALRKARPVAAVPSLQARGHVEVEPEVAVAQRRDLGWVEHEIALHHQHDRAAVVRAAALARPPPRKAEDRIAELFLRVGHGLAALHRRLHRLDVAQGRREIDARRQLRVLRRDARVAHLLVRPLLRRAVAQRQAATLFSDSEDAQTRL